MNKNDLMWLYGNLNDAQLTNALVKYCLHFNTVFNVNEIKYVNVEMLLKAIRNNQEIEIPYKQGAVY